MATRTYNGHVYSQAGPGQPWVKVGGSGVPQRDPIKVRSAEAGAVKAQNEAAASAYDPAAAALENEYKRAQIENMRREQAKENRLAAMPKLTPGQEALDKEFAKEYVDWVNAGGSATVNRNLGTLRSQLPKLEGSDTISGGVMGRLPDSARQFINPDAINVQDNTEQAVMGALKQILGSQFTQAEGERFLARSYNPKVSEAENAKRIRAAEHELADKAWSKGDSAKYFANTGTLQGHTPLPRPKTIGDARNVGETRLRDFIRAKGLNARQAEDARRRFYSDPRVKKLTGKPASRKSDANSAFLGWED